MKDSKYLPIGTVLFIKRNITPYMIAGYINKSNDENIKDYICVPFPYGLINDKVVNYFNHEEIDEIIFKGYVNDKHNKLNQVLKDNYNRM